MDISHISISLMSGTCQILPNGESDGTGIPWIFHLGDDSPRWLGLLWKKTSFWTSLFVRWAVFLMILLLLLSKGNSSSQAPYLSLSLNVFEKKRSHAPGQAWVTGWPVSELFAHVFRAGSRWAHCVWIDESQLFSIHWSTGYWRLIGFASPNGNSLPAIHFQVLCRFFGNTCNSYEWKPSPWTNPLPISRGNKVPDPEPKKVGSKGFTGDPGPDNEEIPPLVHFLENMLIFKNIGIAYQKCT